MLLQTNSYIVPKDKRAEHARQIRRFRQTLLRLGCDHFEVYEQVGPNWSNSESTGRYVQIMRFQDRKHQLAVQAAERNDPTAQTVIADFCELINFPYQQEQGLFAVGFYTSVLPVAPQRAERSELESTVEHQVVEDNGEIPTEEPVDTNGEAVATEEPPAEEASASAPANGEADAGDVDEHEAAQRIGGASETELSDMVNDFLDAAENERPAETTESPEIVDPLSPLEHADRKESHE